MKSWLGPHQNKLLELAKRKYDQNGHSYHNWDHILFCLDAHAEHASSFVNPVVSFAALLFHDSIYDTRRKDNEERSARFGALILQKYDFSSRFIFNFTGSVIATKHTVPTKTLDEDLICDIDMSILGQDRVLFDAYNAGIAREWAWVEPSAYISGRKKFLEGLLGPKPIYRTPNFKSLESKARDNIEYAIDLLSRQKIQ